MQYSICIIDDKIPAAAAEHMRDSDLLNSSNLAYLLSEKEWEEEAIKNLINTLIDAKEEDSVTSKWDVYGFTNPSFLINHLKDGLIRFDIIVFDWDYPGIGQGSGTDSEEMLLQIAQNTFCLVFIFSGVDKQDEINAVLDKPEFKEFTKRLILLDKTVDGTEQSDTLILKAEEMYNSNFSFRFAGQLRRTSVQIMDNVLSDLGRATLNEMKNYLNIEETGEKRDLLDFVAERFRSGLVTSDLPDLEGHDDEQQQEGQPDQELLKRIWSHRLYLPNESASGTFDGLVRRGDIVKCGEELFVVISADCDLRRFWHKNFGRINLIPLNLLDNSNSELRNILTFCVPPGTLKENGLRHLTDNIGKLPEGPFILPFVKIDQSCKNFIVIPKEITTRKIEIHTDVTGLTKVQRKQAYLKYAWWSGSEKICSVSEPFLTAMIQHIFSVLGGYGVPDYPPPMKDIFQAMLSDFISTPGSTS